MNKSELRQNLLAVIHQRQLDQLAALLSGLVKKLGVEAAHHFLRCEVLADLSPADNEWFWSSSTTRLQYQRLIDSVYEGSLELLLSHGKIPGTDFSSYKTTNGKRRLLVSTDTMDELKDYLPKDRHSAMRLVVNPTTLT